MNLSNIIIIHRNTCNVIYTILTVLGRTLNKNVRNDHDQTEVANSKQTVRIVVYIDSLPFPPVDAEVNSKQFVAAKISKKSHKNNHILNPKF